MNKETAAGTHPGEPQTVTVTLPRVEDFAEDFDRAGRMMQAMDLAGDLAPAEFAEWCECAAAIKQRRAVQDGHTTEGRTAQKP